MGTFAVIGYELAGLLLSKGFELVEVKKGKHTTIYYFTDTEELYKEIELYLENKYNNQE